MKKKSLIKLFLLIVFCLSTMGLLSTTQANESEWKFGLGTGFFGLNLDGTVGLDVPAFGGAQELDLDLSASDAMDLMETAFGFGGYATNGSWLIDYSLIYLKLEDQVTNPNSVITNADFKFEVSGFDLMVGYPVFKKSSMVISLHGGVRYTRHEMLTQLTSGVTVSKEIDEEWVDAVFGVSANIPLAEKWIWNNRITAGFGGSEGTYSAQTGVNWQFHKNWSTNLYGKYIAVEFENSTKGATDWYSYDVDEYGLGIGIMYHF